MEWKILAGLRFFLAWIVLCTHVRAFVSEQNIFTIFSVFGGHSAVIGFLIISGYSIANSISRESTNFYKRRIFRIYPLYLCSICFSLLPFLFLNENFPVIKFNYTLPSLWTILGNLFFLQGFIFLPIKTNIVIWTISIEVLNYILAPVYFKISQKQILTIIFISSTLYAFYPYLHLGDYLQLRFGLSFILLAWAWLLGYYYYFNRKVLSKIMLVALGIVLLTVNNKSNQGLSVVTYTLTAILLIYSPVIKLPDFVGKMAKYLGDISYPLYLFHSPTLILIEGVLKIKDSLILIGSSVIIAMWFYHTVDFYSRRRHSQIVI